MCLGAAFLAATAFVSIRFIPKSVGSLSVALWFHSMGVATSLPPLLVSPLSRPIEYTAMWPKWVPASSPGSASLCEQCGIQVFAEIQLCKCIACFLSIFASPYTIRAVREINGAYWGAVAFRASDS